MRVCRLLQVEVLDVALLSSVRNFAQRWDASKRPLHVLINNAGIMSFGCALVRPAYGHPTQRMCGSVSPRGWSADSTDPAAVCPRCP